MTTMKERVSTISRQLRLDSHHAVERSGVIVGLLALIGVLVLSGAGISSVLNGRGQFADTALWTPTFTTSKTDLQGTVDGVFTNSGKDTALVMMHFDPSAKISYSAEDYQAFLLGSDEKMNVTTVSTKGVTGSFHVFGSTGYVGVLLEADEPFRAQILNLTVRANEELSFRDQLEDQGVDEVAGDTTDVKYDQWRVFINPGVEGATTLAALDGPFDPAEVFYELVSKPQEEAARVALDSKLLEMRTNLTQIDTYSQDLITTKVDGLFLRAPQVPPMIADDDIIGQSAAERDDGSSTLALKTDMVMPGGFDVDWRSSNAYEGYLDQVVPEGESYVSFLSRKADEEGTTEQQMDVSDMQWLLSDGTDLARDYNTSDVTMRPLVLVMNNLSQAYQDYYENKREYQTDLTLDLLEIDVDLRNVRSNSSRYVGDDFLVVYTK